jgi:hypothetical protein
MLASLGLHGMDERFTDIAPALRSTPLRLDPRCPD